MHLKFLDTSPLKVFASCLRRMHAVCNAGISHAVPAEATKGVSTQDACNASQCRQCMPNHLNISIKKGEL
jgi:hypothetical protein